MSAVFKPNKALKKAKKAAQHRERVARGKRDAAKRSLKTALESSMRSQRRRTLLTSVAGVDDDELGGDALSPSERRKNS